MKAIAILALLAVTACGANGLPLTPNLGLGINIGPNGITPTANVSTSVGPIRVSAGI